MEKKLSTKRKIVIGVIIVCIIATIAFIWSRSLPSIPESREESSKVVAIVKPILEPIVGEGNVTDHLVSQLAHFSGVATLGGLLALLITARRTNQAALNCLFVGLLVALSDETIQIFSGRGSQVQDVWLDFSGVLFGVVVVLIIALLFMYLRRKHIAAH